MPKKTKQEKILAQQRRHQLAAVVEKQINTTPSQNNTLNITFSLPTTKNHRPSLTESSMITHQLVTKDILKTITLTTAILCIEFLLSRALPK